MKLKIRPLYKLFLILFLIFISLFAIPIINSFGSAETIRARRCLINKLWYQWVGKIINLKVTANGNLTKGRTVFVSNHVSWLDIIVIGQFCPGFFIAKNDISSWPVISILAKQAGTIFIKRGDNKDMLAISQKLISLLQNNTNIIAFPEGTTTRGDVVLPFHSSLIKPALLTDSAVQPIAIKYKGLAKEQAPFIGDDEFAPHLVKMLGMDKVEVNLHFLPVIETDGKNRHTVSREAHTAIQTQILSG